MNKYLILSCLALSCLVLPCLVLSCLLVLSYLILSYLIIYYLILSYLILSYLILSYLTLSYLILSPVSYKCHRRYHVVHGDWIHFMVFPPLFPPRVTICMISCFLYCALSPSETGSSLKGKNLLPRGAFLSTPRPF